MNRKEHDELRAKVRRVYTEVPSKGIYYNSRGGMEFNYRDSDNELKKTYLDPMTSSVVLNALVPKSGVIFRGGHGGGKTTLVEKVSCMLTGIPEEDISSSMIRGNDDQNVNTLLATLKFGKLMTEGQEDVVWRNFVKCFVKIIDEVNRFPPPAQNALFEVLNKGRVEFIDQVYEIDDFMAYATENPNDSGTYPLSKPFVDRFSFCVPAPQIPSAQDQYLLAERPDDKLMNLEAKPIMNLEELKKARKMISEEVKMGSQSLIYTIYLTQAVSTCERGDYNDKSHNDIVVGERCKGCGFDTATALCKMTETGLSGRAFLDFQRWGKAYSWFLNAFPDPSNPRVQQSIIEAIAPYLMYHRTQSNEMLLAKDPYHGARLKYLTDVVGKATQEYGVVYDALKEVPQILRGDIKPNKSAMWSIDKNLVVKHHFKPMVEEADNKEFREIYDKIEAEKNLTATKQLEIKKQLALESSLKPPAQKFLLSKAMAKARREEHL